MIHSVFYTVEHLILRVFRQFDELEWCLRLEVLDTKCKTHRHHHRIFLAFVILPLQSYFLFSLSIFVPHDFQCWITTVGKLQIGTRNFSSHKIRYTNPLLSITSTGSSKICVTFGKVSSAFSTGNVFDRKSRVRLRISSLQMNRQRKEKKIDSSHWSID